MNHGGKLAGARVYRAVWESRTVEGGRKEGGRDGRREGRAQGVRQRLREGIGIQLA